MSRVMCFFDEKDGQWASCIDKFEGDCSSCKHNPFPGGIIPEDRVLRRKRIQFEYEPLTDEEYAEMKVSRVYDRKTGVPRRCFLYRNSARVFHYRHNVRR